MSHLGEKKFLLKTSWGLQKTFFIASSYLYRVFHSKMLFIRPQVESIDKNLIQRFYLACFHVSQSITSLFLIANNEQSQGTKSLDM